MPWKENDDKSLVRDDKGNPIWLNEAGEEKAVDYPAMSAGLSTANREAAERKAKLREAETKLEMFKDIEDLPAWLTEANKALETVKGLPEKDRDMEERIRAQVAAATKPKDDKIAELGQKIQATEERLQREAVSNAFSRSTFAREKMIDPVLASDLFSKHFSLNQDGKIVATDSNGQVIYGENGEAGFDEALAKLVDSYSGRDFLLKGSKGSGSGATGGAGGGGSGTPKSLAECKTEAEKIAYLNLKVGATP